MLRSRILPLFALASLLGCMGLHATRPQAEQVKALLERVESRQKAIMANDVDALWTFVSPERQKETSLARFVARNDVSFRKVTAYEVGYASLVDSSTAEVGVTQAADSILPDGFVVTDQSTVIEIWKRSDGVWYFEDLKQIGGPPSVCGH